MIIDVSKWNGTLDWKKLKSAGVEMAILRASCGTSIDSMLAVNANGAAEAGVPFGVYHYSMAQSETVALSEIKTLYNGAKAYKPCFWVLDIEDPAQLYKDGKQLPMNPNLGKIVGYMYDQLRKRVGSNGKIIYYGGSSVFEPYGHLSSIKWDALWFANYGASKTPYAALNGSKIYCDLWQYSSKGRINGASGNLDCSRIAAESAKGLSWWIGTAAASPASVVEPVLDKNGDGKVVRIAAGTWNIRSGPGTEYQSVGLFAAGGEGYEWVATAWNGWLAIPIRDGIGWISGTGAEVIEHGR